MQGKINKRIRNSMNKCLRGGKGHKSWREFVPYTIDDLIYHLKSTIPDGYTWEDFLSGKLHVDHIIPVSAFNYSSPEDIDFKKCWDLKNLRLLSASENLSKSNKIDKPFQPSLAFGG